MKHECNVARDLMPLVLDGAASDESRKLLEEHLEECAACKEYFGGMKAALPMARAANSEPEEKVFDEAARKLRKKRRFRLWRNVLIGILIGALVAGGSFWAWSLTQGYRTPVYHGEYNVFLSQLADGSVSVNVDFQGSFVNMSVALEEYRENGKQILYISNYASRFRHVMGQPMPNYSCARLLAEDLANLAEIREGTPDECAVVWKAGDIIPAASEEMETYFALLDQRIALLPVIDEDGRPRAFSFEESQRHKELSEQVAYAEKAVPEWQ